MLKLDFPPFPVLRTPRLQLRALVLNDAPALYRLRSNVSANAFVGRPATTTLPQVEDHIRHVLASIAAQESLYWVITRQHEEAVMGTICLWNFTPEQALVELGYELLPDYQGQGFMLEAVQGVIQYGFEQLQARTITAFPSADNTRSIALLEKANFTRVGNSFPHTQEEVTDLVTYVLANDRFPEAALVAAD